MFSCESCFPFHSMEYTVMLYFYFSFLTLIPTNWLVRKRWFSRLPQWDIKQTFNWQFGSSGSRPLLPLWDFHFVVAVGIAAFVWKTSRTESPVMWQDPTYHYTHCPLPPAPSTHRRVLMLHECLTDRKKTSCAPKLTSTLKWKRYNLKNTIGQYVWLCTCIERNVI